MTTSDVPVLDGIHHVKLPVADLDRTLAWYSSRLGYRVEVRFTEGGRTTGLAMAHPNGGPNLAFRLDPDRAARASGFDFFSIGVPDKAALQRLADRLTEFGDDHVGVHFATIGWILPGTHDPDGHEVRFYTTEHHTRMSGDHETVIEDAVGSAERREQSYLATTSD